MISDIKKQGEDIRFDDPDFRLIVKPDCVSSIDTPNRTSKAFHKEIEIKYFYEGNATLLVGSKIVQATAGDLVVMNPYEFHSTIRFGENKGKYHLIMIDPDSFFSKETGGTSLKQMTAWSDFEFDTHIKNDGRIPELMLRIAEEQKRKSPYYRLMLKGLMMELFALLLRDYAKTEQSDSADENIRYFETVEPAIQRIRDKYFEKITAEDLSSLCNVSKCHFCRIFKKATGKTAMQYLTDYRLQIADVLLSDPSHTISMIAEKCGFEDESYFCRCYKRKFGSSPGQKRSKRMKQKNFNI